MSLELVSLGSVSSTIFKPMEVLSIPLQKKAVGVILVHNHPSGRLEASEADKDLTDLLIQACRIMRTPVLDHVIITEHSYMSFKETGLLDRRLEASLKYVPPYELERQYYEEMQTAIRKVEKESRRKIQEVKQESLQKVKKGEEKGMKKGRQEGLQEGLEKGEALGEEKGMRKVARQMLQAGEPMEKIKKWTGLTEAQVQELRPKTVS